MKSGLIGLCFVYFLSGAYAIKQPNDSKLKQVWEHVSIRPGAEMFFWVYYTKNYTHRPLVIWLQGGPGSSSTGVGNFLEIGQLDLNQKTRDNAWTNNASVLFIDSPVGSGYSYVWDADRIPKNTTEAAKDLVTFMKFFYDKISDFRNSPLYIFGESYGGKIAVEFAVHLLQAVKAKKIDCHLKGVALGDPWISPADSVENYAKFLYANSLIDVENFEPLVETADKISKDIVKGSYLNASSTLFNKMEPLIANATDNVNVYNILAPTDQSYGNAGNNTRGGIFHDILPKDVASDLSQLMNGPIKKRLRMPRNVTWDSQSSLVFTAMNKTFMEPAFHTVEYLLNNTKLDIMVYNGQLDLIVPTIGSETWINKMKWPGTARWKKSKRRPFRSKNNETLGFYKKFKNFSFFWILKAGHMVPLDAPTAAQEMFCLFTGLK